MTKRTKCVLAVLWCVGVCGAWGQQVASSWNVDDTNITIFTPAITDTVRLFVISDTHLFLADEREEPYKEYSNRMSKAYNTTKHFKTGEATDPMRQLQASMEKARQFRADAIVHMGDLLSFPSECGVEWSRGVLDASGIAWYYISGNHDWHYEGMEGSEESLRGEWTVKRLSALYRGHSPLAYAVDVKGVKLLLIDDSINGMLPWQVDFFNREVADGKPSMLFMHVPLAAAGRTSRGYTIGSHEWGAAIDHNYAIRRPQWPSDGHQQADYDFRDAVVQAGKDNLLAVCCGHVHVQTCSYLATVPMFTVRDNASGGFYCVTLVPQR